MNAEFIEIIKRNNYVILDTETTGLDKPAEICQIAIIDRNANALLNTLVRTAQPIPASATAIHGITDADVANAPWWQALVPTIQTILNGRDVIVYNAVYDRKLMHWSDEAWNLPHIDWKLYGRWHCAMEAYAAFYGEVHPYYGSFKWQSLSNATRQQGLEVNDAHDALGDCLMTRSLMLSCVARLNEGRRGGQE